MSLIHLTNWSSRKLHHGRKWTIMARPRHWETGLGKVEALTPDPDMLEAVKLGEITIVDYRRAFLEQAGHFSLGVGELGYETEHGRTGPVEAGDTMCCACSKADALAGKCHRVWAGYLLGQNGWRVVLDGQPMRGMYPDGRPIVAQAQLPGTAPAAPAAEVEGTWDFGEEDVCGICGRPCPGFTFCPPHQEEGVRRMREGTL